MAKKVVKKAVKKTGGVAAKSTKVVTKKMGGGSKPKVGTGKKTIYNAKF